MKKKLLPLLLFIFVLLAAGTVDNAQDMKAKKWDNAHWKSIHLIKFQSGKMPRAKEIIQKYFAKAGQKAGLSGPSLEVDLVTGDYDMMVVWDMKGGVEDLNWETSPDDAKWYGAMSDIAGGADKAKTLQDEFSSLIVRETSYLGK